MTLIDWLLTPIDATRAHDLGMHLKYHGRLMVVAWGLLVPVGIVAARFFKVLPRQRFPVEVDDQVCWRAHRAVQSTAHVLVAVGLYPVLTRPHVTTSLTATIPLHHALGWGVLWLGCVQIASAAFRGTKAGRRIRTARCAATITT